MIKEIAIIGGGPSGLMAADILSDAGCAVTIYERKPSFGRKFLMAGRGGLNITHSEKLDQFVSRYNEAANILKPIIDNFTPQNMRDWCMALGEETFIGSSGRVFPKSFKASPLLRAWLARLEKQNVTFKTRHDWQGWDEEVQLSFETPEGVRNMKADATLLALGGASWPSLGSDGSWVDILKKDNVEIAPLRPSNCGFFVEWSDIFSKKFEGKSLKSVALNFQGKSTKGEFMITKNGVEGGAIYALSSFLREAIARARTARLMIDLKPDLGIEQVMKRLQKPRSKLSLSNYLRKVLNLSDVAIGLIMELPERQKLNDFSAQEMAKIIKSYPLCLTRPFAMDRAISTAGGVKFNQIDDHFMLRHKPNVFVTGEMLDWEAPTGGYLLQACMASGVHVARGMLKAIKDD